MFVQYLGIEKSDHFDKIVNLNANSITYLIYFKFLSNNEWGADFLKL